MRPLLPVLAAIVLATGCATSSHFDALSSKHVPYLGYPIEGPPPVRDVAAEVVTREFLWIPTNTRSPTLQDAVDAALERGNGNLLVDVDVDHWWVWVPFLYGQEGWRVHGDVVRREESQ